MLRYGNKWKNTVRYHRSKLLFGKRGDVPACRTGLPCKGLQLDSFGLVRGLVLKIDLWEQWAEKRGRKVFLTSCLACLHAGSRSAPGPRFGCGLGGLSRLCRGYSVSAKGPHETCSRWRLPGQRLRIRRGLATSSASQHLDRRGKLLVCSWQVLSIPRRSRSQSHE
jgi:hypothetical protein